MRKIKIKIQVDDKTFVLEPMKVALPEYETQESAGCDLTNNGKAVTLLPLDRAFIHTGVHISLLSIGYSSTPRCLLLSRRDMRHRSEVAPDSI